MCVAAPSPLSAPDGPGPAWALFGGRNTPQPPGSPVLPAPVRGVAFLGAVGPGTCLPLGTSLPVAEPPGLQKVTAELLSEAVCNQLLEMPSERGERLLL